MKLNLMWSALIDLRHDSSFKPETSSELSELKVGVSGKSFINYFLKSYSNSLSNIDQFIEFKPNLDLAVAQVSQLGEQVKGIINFLTI